MGVIRDYVFPKLIKGNTTYFADVIITSRTYMEALFNQQKNQQQPSEPSIKREPESRRQVEQFHPQRNQGSWSHDSEKNQGSIPMDPKSFTKPDFHFYAGIGFNAVSLMGPSAHLGFRYKLFCLEGGFVYGLDKVENVTFTLQGSSTPSEAYDYSCSKAWARLGLRLKVAESIHITPMAGATFNMISGKSTLSSSSSTNYFKESNPMSIHAAVRFSCEVVKHLHLHVTPQYDFSLNGDQVYTIIKEADSKLKSWGKGFGVNVGIIYEF